MMFYFIMTLLATTVPVKGMMECNISKPTEAQQCFGELGEPLTFYLPKDEIIKLKKNTKLILKTYNDGRVVIHSDYKHSAFFKDRTFKLDNVTKTESGDYLLETYGHDGESQHKINIHLEIQAPVTKPTLSQMCLSPELMNVSCSSEGDGVEFTLTLDSNFLIKTRENVSISLYGELTGSLTCSVHNDVSREETVIHLTSCKGSVCHVTVVVTAIASAAISLLLLAAFHGFKHLRKNTSPTTLNDKTEDEIVYSDVRVMKHITDTRPNMHR